MVLHGPTMRATRVALVAGCRPEKTNPTRTAGLTVPQPRCRLPEKLAERERSARNERDSSCTRCRLPERLAERERSWYSGLPEKMAERERSWSTGPQRGRLELHSLPAAGEAGRARTIAVHGPATSATRVALVAGFRQSWPSKKDCGPRARNEGDSSCTRCRLPERLAERERSWYSGLPEKMAERERSWSTGPQRGRFELHSLPAAGEAGRARTIAVHGDSSCTRCRLPAKLAEQERLWNEGDSSCTRCRLTERLPDSSCIRCRLPASGKNWPNENGGRKEGDSSECAK